MPEETIQSGPGFERRVSLAFPAAYPYLSMLGAAVEAILSETTGLFREPAQHEQLVFQVRLATHEVCTNIIDHAYASQPGPIQVQMVLEHSGRLVIDFYDHGLSFDPQSIAKPNLDEAQTRGYGLFLVHELMNEVFYESRPDHNHWRLVKALEENAT